jgi:hypothetical protein
MAFEEYMRARLFEPLGLSRTSFELNEIYSYPNRAVGEWKLFRDRGGELPVKVPMVAAGGLYTCVEDALRYIQFHLRSGEKVLDPAHLAEMYRIPAPAPGQKFGYGLGVASEEWGSGLHVLNHGGGGFGFLCSLFWIPAISLGAVVLTNSVDHSLQQTISRTVANELRRRAGLEPDREAGRYGSTGSRGQLAQSDDRLSRLAGEYIGRGGDRIELEIEGDELTVHPAGSHARLIDDDVIEVDNATPETYRFLPGDAVSQGYLQSLRDGFVRYRNDANLAKPTELPNDTAVVYRIDVWGTPIRTLLLHQAGDKSTIEYHPSWPNSEPGSSLSLHLTKTDEKLYHCTMGETLDLRGDRPTYANIPLDKVSD